VSDEYLTDEFCERFAERLNADVRGRAQLFFMRLAAEKKLSSVELAELLGCERREIGGNLTRWPRS